MQDIVTLISQKYNPGDFEEKKSRYMVFIKALLEDQDKYKRVSTVSLV